MSVWGVDARDELKSSVAMMFHPHTATFLRLLQSTIPAARALYCLRLYITLLKVVQRRHYKH